MNSFEQLKQEIMADSDNRKYTDVGIEPLFSTPNTAKILIIGQAPGIKAQESKIFFNDKSGVKLREWMGIDDEIFYKSGLISIILVKVKVGIYHQEKTLPKNGMLKFWNLCLI